jgi:hypothetical protein
MEGATGLTRAIKLECQQYLHQFRWLRNAALIGLGGAYVVADSNAWGVLWVAIVLLAAVLLTKTNALARTITGLALGGVFWTAVAGSTAIKAAVAAGLVWLMLIGGFWDTIVYGANSGAQEWILVARHSCRGQFGWARFASRIALSQDEGDDHPVGLQLGHGT